MSEERISKQLKELEARAEEIAIEEQKRKAISDKELALKEHRVGQDYERFVRAKKDEQKAKTLNFSCVSPSEVERIITSNREYLEAAKRPMLFINKEFDSIVPFYKKNFITVAGPSGQGKSTAVANIVASCILQLVDGRAPRILLITNEEEPSDVYNRITCHLKGWKYADHHEFTPEQLAEFERMIPVLAKRITVISNNYEGMLGTTTTIEGVKSIFENIIENNIHYDAFIIDYYQKINSSRNFPKMNPYEVQHEVCYLLDGYKNVLPGPIVLMAQCNEPDKEETPLDFRIKGRKTIFETSTLVIEMIRDSENLRTIWEVWKSRFTSAIGEKVETGFDRGRFVPYSDEFKSKVLKFKEQKEREKILNGAKEVKSE